MDVNNLTKTIDNYYSNNKRNFMFYSTITKN